MREKGRVWLNGNLIPWEKATVPLLSHGFSRGSAIFEVLGIHEGREGPVAFRIDQHVKRLMRSAQLLGMKMAYSESEIFSAVAKTVKANNMGRGLVKILAYWGEEAVIKLVLESNLDLAIFAIPASEELGLDNAEPVSACFSKWRKIHPETMPVEAKACANYLNGYLIRFDANRRGFNVGFALGTDGFLAEGSTESVFLVKDGMLRTPPRRRILSSITRMSILQALPALGIPFSEESILPDEVLKADEIFLCHTGIKVLPVRQFEQQRLEAPGPITRKILTLMEDITNFSDDRFRDWFFAMH